LLLATFLFKKEEHPMSILGKSVSSGPDRGRLFILLTGVLWSLAGVFIKFLELHPLTITFYRSFFAWLFFSPFLRQKPYRVDRPLLISVSTYTAAICSFVWANKLTTAANAIVLQYTAPIFVFIFVRLLFGEPISKNNFVTLLMGMSGVGIIFLGSVGQPDAGGVLVAVLSGFLFATYMVNLRYVKQATPVYLTWINNLACFLILVPLVWSRLALAFDEALALAIMGVVQLGIPYFLFSKALETVSLQEASLIVLIEPVLNPIWVALVVGEIPSTSTLIGGAVILASLGVRYLRLAHQATPSEPSGSRKK
jgi:drug/metabolite transporter (DMT)-like permease